MASIADESLVRCPSCRLGFLSQGAEQATCGHCSAAFRVAGGVVDLLPSAAERPSLVQRAMEWNRLVRIYESRLWRRNPLLTAAFGCTFEEEQAAILRSLSLRPEARVLDLACGSGIYTRPLARAAPAGVVLGLDLSWPMLSYAAARAREEQAGNILWLRASALDIPIADAALDGVSCCAALHLFSDLPRALSEIRRVLAPGGRFAFGMARRREGWLGDAETMATAWSGLTPRSGREVQRLLEDAGFADVEIHHAKRLWQIACAVRRR